MYWESAIELSMINQTQDSLFAGDNELVTGLGLSLDIVDPDLVRGFNEEYPMATNDQTWLSPQTSEMDSQPEASTYSPYTSLTRRPQRPQSLNDNFQPSLHVTPISTAQRWYGWSNQSFDHSSSYSSPYATCLSPTGGSDHMGSLTSTSTTPWSINSSYPNPTQYNAVDSPCGAMTEEDYLKDDIGLSYLNFDHTLTEESCLDPALEPQSPCPQSEISSCTSTEQTQIREDSISRHSIIYACNICGIEYNRRSSLKSHLRSHATKRTKAQCPKDGCGKTYGRQADLARHIRSFHTKEVYPCQYCGKEFHRSDIRNRHIDDFCQTIRKKAIQDAIENSSNTFQPIQSQCISPWSSPNKTEVGTAKAAIKNHKLK